LGWDTISAFDKEGFGERSTLGRLNIKESNPGLPELTYRQAYKKMMKKS
jgi:type I restriction enzyme R subunit